MKVEGWIGVSHVILIGVVLLAGCQTAGIPPNPDVSTPTVYSQALFATQTALVVSTPTLSPMPVLISPTSSKTHTPEPSSQHGDSFSPSISPDGRYVAFTSRSGDLVKGEMPKCSVPDGSQVNCSQVYVYDRQNGVMTLASAAEDGTPGNGNSDQADISFSNQYWFVFRSEATNLIPGEAGAAGAGGIFVRGLDTGKLERLAIELPASRPTISARGDAIAFSAFNEHWDVFLYSRATHTTQKISVALDGGNSDGDSLSARISSDGRWVAFWSWAGNLVPGDTEKCQESPTNYSCGDVFLYSVENGQIQRIPAGEGYGSGMGYYDVSLSGGDGDLIQYGCSIFNRNTVQFVCGDGECCGKISPDGNWLAYGGVDFYVRELASGEEKLVSVSSEGIRGNGELVDYINSTEGKSFEPGFGLSVDGYWVTFASTASNLVEGDSFVCSDYPFPPHNCYDIFVHDRQTDVTEWISKPLPLNISLPLTPPP